MIDLPSSQSSVGEGLRPRLAELFMGSGFPLVITLAALPILTRLYTPAEFGEFSLYFALAQMVAVFVSGKYDFALLTLRKSNDSFRVLRAGVLFSLLMAAVVLVALLVAGERVEALFPSSLYRGLVWLLPAVGLMLALRQLMTMWEARRQQVGVLAGGKLLNSVLINGLRLPRGVYSSGAAGLWFSFLLSELSVLALSLFRFWKNDRHLVRRVGLSTEAEPLYQHGSYPMVSMPLALLNFISSNLLLFAFSFNFSLALVGLYDRFLKMIGIPLDMLASSLGSLFGKRKGSLSSRHWYYLSVYASSLLAVAVAYLPLIIWGPRIFGFIMGANWQFAGVIAQYLAPLVIVSFATKSVLGMVDFGQRRIVLLIWQILYLLMVAGWLFYARSHSLVFVIKTYAVLSAALYLLLAIIGFVMLAKEPRDNNRHFVSKSL